MNASDFKHVFDRLAEPSVIIDADGIGSYVNPAAAEVLAGLRDFDAHQPVRDADWGVIDPAGLPLSGDQLPSEITRLTGRELTGFEFGAPTRTGEIRWLRVSTRTLGPGPPPCAVVSTYTDVSARHRLAAELAEARVSHATILETLTEGVILHDAEVQVIAANSSAARLLGLTDDQLRGEVPMPPGWEAVDEQGDAIAREDLPFGRAVRTGERQAESVVGVRAHGRGLRWMRVNAVPVRDSDGRLTGAVTSFADITEQRRSETDRVEAERRFETSFAHAPTGIALIDLEGRMLRANQALCDIFARDEAELLAANVADYTHPDDLGATTGVYDRLTAGEEVHVQKRYLRPDGEVVWAMSRAATVRDATGRPTHVVAHVQDITALKRAESERAEAMKLFETVFASAPTAVALFGPDMRLQRANRRLYEMLGRDAEELVGETLHAFTHPDDLTTTATAWSDLRNVQPVAIQKRYVRPDGTIVWAQTYGTTICDEQGRPSFVISHLHDITVQKAAELRQAEMTAEFEAAFSDGPIGMAVVSPDGRWLRVNRQLCQLLGYDEPELLGLTFQEITHPDDLDADLELVRQLLDGKIERYTMEKRYRTAEGNLLWTTLAVSLVRDAAGAPLHFISQIEDITERKRLERELQYMAEHDSLTGIWNRRRFDEALTLQVKRSQRYRERAALLAVDLNEFKAINDTHGHQAGDAVICAVAGALKRRLRETDTVARVGGDEFAVILVNVAPREAEELAATLRAAVAALRIPVPATTLRISASIGAAMIEASTPDAAAALIEADAAMYRDKLGAATRHAPAAPVLS